MSVRVYQLANQLGLSNGEVVELLRARGLNVNGPSNTIPTIYADALIEELGGPKPKEGALGSTEPKAEDKQLPPLIKNAESGGDTVIVSNAAVVRRAPSPKPVPQRGSLEGDSKDVKMSYEKKPTSGRYRGDSDKRKDDVPLVSFSGIDISKKRDDFKQKAEAGNSNIGKGVEDSTQNGPKPAFKQFLKKIERPTKNDVLKPISIKQPIIVRDLAVQMDVKPFQLISKLMSMNVFASMNQTLDPAIAQQVAEKFGFDLEIKQREAETKLKQKEKQSKKPVAATGKVRNLSTRSPIVCVLGHVDHGKTTLLDTIRKAQVAQGEAGGITQHVAAYQVEQNGKKVTFIDTPGHAAFSKMRERGANLTDIAVLVVAADDGFMPQTDEALNFAKKANIPVIVAINKIDAKGANVDRVKQQMQQRGITPEDWGGETLCAPISALKGTNITDLLELILLQAEMLELQADPSDKATGIILESQIETGRGPTASAIIQDGTLHIGDCIVCGTSYCKVRSMISDSNGTVKEAIPATPIKIIGWTDIPAIGETFTSVQNEKEARRIVEENFLAMDKAKNFENNETTAITDLDQLLSAISAEREKVLRIIIRADVHGSAEALEECLLAIDSKKIKLEIISIGVGSISKNDIELASTAGATIVAFNTKFENGAQASAKNQQVPVIQHNIIYEIVNQVRDAMAAFLDPELREQKLGATEVRQIFTLKSETIAGCMVTEGKILRDQFVRIIRKKNIIFQGKFASIKHLKEDVTEIRAGFECGIRVSGFDQFEIGDIIECFEIKKIQPTL
ncbi:MAG: translation initiation factor IF-2 [Puniceicoccales bacterium]|jgi:translation initiation factor IF-2|nr:translation initiation factor IF-2 [Puniceicoccales bacterium]